MQKIDTIIGSGPFTFNQTETRPAAYVYDKNPTYNPRTDPPAGPAGAKIVS